MAEHRTLHTFCHFRLFYNFWALENTLITSSLVLVPSMSALLLEVKTHHNDTLTSESLFAL